MIDTNYMLWMLGLIWWTILIYIDDDRASEKSEPGC